ncbi:MAG: ABC transporter permease, partial [Chloroflexi bacterium]|nr:ABC transporter permease [Chloroflexota bacterium]
LIMTSVNPEFHKQLIPAMILFSILSGTLLGLPALLVEAREAGIFRSYKINGVPAISLLVIPALTTIFHMVIVTAVITATAPVFFDATLPVNWPGFLLVGLGTIVAYAGLGALVGVISTNSQTAMLWSQIIYLPSILLSGMMVPTDLLPDALGKVGLLLPGTYAMHAFQGLAWGRPVGFDPIWSVVILLAGGLAAFGLAIYLFSWDRQNATRRGHPLLALLALLPYAAGVVAAVIGR